MSKIKALIWKEWRESRMFFIVGIVLIIVSKFVMNWLLPTQSNLNRFWFVEMANVVLPFFASIIATIPFCSDFEQNSEDFLQSRPVSSAKIFFVKYTFSFILMLIMVVIIQLVYMDMPLPNNNSILHNLTVRNYLRDLSNMDFSYPFMFFMMLITLYSGVFLTSLIVRKTLPAIFLTPLTILCIFPVLIPFFLALCLTFTVTVGVSLLLIALSIILITCALVLWIKVISKGYTGLRVFRRLFIIISAFFLFFIIIYAGDYIITGIRLNLTIAQAEKAGLVFDEKKIIPPEIPENKSPDGIYKKGFKLSDQLCGVLYAYPPPRKELPYEEKIQYIFNDPECKKLFSIIDEAAILIKSNTPWNDLENELPLPDLRYMRGMYELNTLRIKYYIEEGRNKEAMKAADAAFEMADALNNNRYLGASYIREGIIYKTIAPLKDLPGDPMYKKWIQSIELREKNIKDMFVCDMHWYYKDFFERLLNKSIFDDKHINRYYSTRKSGFSGLLYSYNLATPVIKLEMIKYLQHMIKELEYLKQPYWKIYNVHELKYPNNKPLVSYLPENGGFQYFSLLEGIALSKAHRYQQQVFLALKLYKAEHGHYPAKLTELVPDVLAEVPIDPFSGKELMYKKQGEGFILYSVGTNMKDDGGNIDSIRNGFSIRKNDDITFECKR